MREEQQISEEANTLGREMSREMCKKIEVHQMAPLQQLTNFCDILRFSWLEARIPILPLNRTQRVFISELIFDFFFVRAVL